MSEDERKGLPALSRRDFLRGAAAGAAALVLKILPWEVSATAAGGGEDEEESKNRIWEQVIKPSKYEVHALRTVDGMTDISLEKIRMVSLVFWPKDVTPELDKVKQPVEEMLTKTGEFWQRALESKTTVKGEFLPVTFTGQKTRDEYSSVSEIIPELEDQLKIQIEDQQLLEKVLDLLQRARTGQTIEDSAEYLNLVIFVMGPTTKFLGHSSASLGVTYINSDVSSIVGWQANRWDNLVAHEVGHGLSLPDQYKTNTSNDEWWYDPDPTNIMGSNMWGISLSEARIAESVKKWLLNKGTGETP